MCWPGCESPDAALEHEELLGPGCVPALWDAGMVPVGPWGTATGSSGVPVISRGSWPAQPQHRQLHIPCSPPPQTRQGISQQVWKAEELSAKA